MEVGGGDGRADVKRRKSIETRQELEDACRAVKLEAHKMAEEGLKSKGLDLMSLLEDLNDEQEEVVDQQESDLSRLSIAEKDKCEECLRQLYFTFRERAKSELSSLAYLDSDPSEVTVSAVSANPSYFDDVRVSTSVLKLFVDKERIRDIAINMEIKEDELMLLALDHVWKEYGQTIDGYNLSLICEYIGISTKCLHDLALYVRSMDGTARSVMEDCSLTEERINALFGECQEIGTAIYNQAREPLPLLLFESDGDTLLHDRNFFEEIAHDVEELRKTVATLPPIKMVEKAILFSPGDEERFGRWADASGRMGTLTAELSKGLPSASAGQEEISVVDVVMKNYDQMSDYLDADSLRLEDLPPGTSVFARQCDAANFVDAHIIAAKEKRYDVKFSDGKVEYDVELSRVAVELNGNLRNWEGMRICALYKKKLDKEKFESAIYAGTVGMGPYGSSREILVFFDNGFDGTVLKQNVCLLTEQQYLSGNSVKIFDNRGNWVLAPKSRQLFLKHYLQKFPDWQLVRMKRRANTQRVNVMRGQNAFSAYVLDTDRQFALLRFPTHRKHGSDCVTIGCQRHAHVDEWIYRGSERLDAIRQTIEKEEGVQGDDEGTPQPTRRASRREVSRLQQSFEYAVPVAETPSNVVAREPYSVEPDERDAAEYLLEGTLPNDTLQTPIDNDKVDLSSYCSRGQLLLADNDEEFEIYRRKQTARKSAARPVCEDALPQSFATSIAQRVKKLQLRKVMPWTVSRKNHSHCDHSCLLGMDKDPRSVFNKKFFENYSPFAYPQLVGWTRQVFEFPDTANGNSTKRRKAAKRAIVTYRAPCGKSFYELAHIAAYLKETFSALTIDLFTFDSFVRPGIFYCSPVERRKMDDYSGGQETPLSIPVVNEWNDEFPAHIRYEVKRIPFDSNTEMCTISSGFCSGCSCIDDCSNEKACECRQMTRIENSRLAKSLQTPEVAVDYSFGRLLRLEDVTHLSGIYECNEHCRCNKRRCYNRVVQQGIKFPLELFKTKEIGWGVRTLVDIPAGSFVCNYVGTILTDDQAERQGKLAGDTYFADIDFVKNVESEKRNAGVDLEDGDGAYVSDSDEDQSWSASPPPHEQEDDEDFGIGDEVDSSDENSNSGDEQVRPRRPQRGKSPKMPSGNGAAAASRNNDGSNDIHQFATKSLRLTAQQREEDEDLLGNMTRPRTGNGGARPFDLIKYIEHAGKTSLFTVDSLDRGNIGRFFNHSCSPNMRIFCVFVDTHDLRLPWMSFFTTKNIRAGEELCWDYGYVEGTVVGKSLHCKCGAKKCRKRLL